MLPFIKKLSEAEELLYSESARLKGIESGNIRIGTFSSVACHILVPVITEFKKLYPNINIEIREGDNLQVEQWLMQGRVDFGFIGAPAPNDFETVEIYRDPFVAVLSEDSEYSGMKVVPLGFFEQMPIVLFDEGTRKEAAGLLKKQKIKTNVAYVSRDDSMILSLIENNLCAGFMGRLILNRTTYNVTYCYTEPQLYRDIVLAIRSKKDAGSAATKFIDFMEKILDSVISELEFE